MIKWGFRAEDALELFASPSPFVDLVTFLSFLLSIVVFVVSAVPAPPFVVSYRPKCSSRLSPLSRS